MCLMWMTRRVDAFSYWKVRDGVPLGAVTAAHESMYIWRPPRTGVADESNGTIEKLAVMLDPH